MLGKNIVNSTSVDSRNSNRNRWIPLDSLAASISQQISYSPDAATIPGRLTQRSSAESNPHPGKPAIPRVIDHVSDQTLFGGGTVNTIGAIAIYDAHIAKADKNCALFTGSAQFFFDEQTTTFLIHLTSIDQMVEVELGGAEHHGVLTLSGEAISRIETGATLFRIPIVNSIDQRNGEFEIVVLSFNRQSGDSAIQHSQYCLAFRNRRWKIGNELHYSTDISSCDDSKQTTQSPPFVVGGRIQR